MRITANPSVTVRAPPSRRICRDSPAWSIVRPGALRLVAAVSSTRNPSSLVTPAFTAPNTRTELRCWNRVRVRGAVVASITVDHDARLGQIDLQIGIDVQELAALPPGTDHGTGPLQHLLRRLIALQHELDVVGAGSRQRRVEPREHAHARDL